MASTWSFAVDQSSSIEEEMLHVREEADRLGRVVVGEPVIIEAANSSGSSGWWLSVTVRRAGSAAGELALAPA
ncbi:MAG: hypothetical protein ACJ76P_00435 [Actinomycetota bacterium]